MFKVQPLFFLISFIFCVSSAFASDTEKFIEKAKKLKLSEDRYWKQLLFYNGGRTQILDKDFFLSSRGGFDPEAELEATIEEYFHQRYMVPRDFRDKNIVCHYPARYLWLNSKLNLPNFKIDSDFCPGLSHWARLDQIESISVIYVSGYLGNPASSFGHVLLNLKIKDSEELLGLFDTSITYGATVPLHENIIFYALKGLLGGYTASFSDKYFYANDQVYTNREFRDMWEYTLNLSEFDKKILIYQTAELLTKKFRYYFLGANCAQRMAVLLNTVVPERTYNLNYPIYVPEELFHRLQHIDQKRRFNGKEPLIKNIKYIPSARRYLYYETAQLSNEERRAYRLITERADKDFSADMKGLGVNGRINVLNSLLAYQYYKLMASDEAEANLRLKEYKDKILLERLRLPAQKENLVPIPEVPSPRAVSPPSSFNAGLITERGQKTFPAFGVTIFKKESVGLNALEYNELVALDLNLGYLPDQDRVIFDRFDFIKIRDFRTFYIPEARENPFSWRVRAGMDRLIKDDTASIDYALDGGVGVVKKLKDFGILYGFINSAVHSLNQQYRAGPTIGCIVGNKSLKLETDYGLEFGLEYFDSREILESKIQYQINKENAVQLSYQKNIRERLSVGYIYYW